MIRRQVTEEVDSNDIENTESTVADTDKVEEVRKERNKKKKGRNILAIILIVVLLILIIGILVFYYLRQRGAEGLKAEDHYVTYDGKKYKFKEDIVNILCLGIDKTEPISHIEKKRGNIGMADTILLVSIDLKKDKVKVLAIPRDTMAQLQLTDEDGNFTQTEELQLCYQYAFGRSMEQSNELTVDAVCKLLYGLPIQRCCAINFEALPIINDAIGGVDVVVQEDLEEFVPEFVYGKQIHLEGDLALKFIRSRNTKRVDGVVLRTQRQKQYVLAFVEKAKSIITENPAMPISIFQELQKKKDMCTDITIDDITYLMPQLLDISLTDDVIEVLPGESELGENKFAEYHLDKDSVKKILIDNFYEEV